MAKARFKEGLALMGACAALAVVVPPLAGLLNAVAGVTLLAMTGYAAYRAWAFLEAVVEASRRPATVRRNLSAKDDPPARSPRPRQRGRGGEEREFTTRAVADRQGGIRDR